MGKRGDGCVRGIGWGRSLMIRSIDKKKTAEEYGYALV
jgi:hypothetical protein